MEKSGKQKNYNNGKYKKSKKPENYCRSDDDADTTCCFCIKTKKNKKKGLIAGCVTNLGIFVLLLAYTLLGAFIFLAIEGSAAKVHQKTLAATSYQANQKVAPDISKLNDSISQASAELRSQTVESIWEITVSLNILYKENWTKLAAQEIARFQEKLFTRVAADVTAQYGGARALESVLASITDDYEWNFAKAFLYSLTVLTTIGYGSVAPKTSLGKAVTIGYAVIGIPLTLLYLSVVGALLSRLARSVFSRALCCCLCTKCGYCCLDERTMTDKERKEKVKRQVDYHSQTLHLQEPYYVRSPSGTIISASQAHGASANTAKDKSQSLSFLRDCDSLSCTDTDSKVSLRGLTILAPVVLCLCAIFAYIFFGAFILHQIEGWSLIDGIYFCFMSLSTIGFGHLAPGATQKNGASTGTVWFCSIYIMTGLALTAMCFNVLHDEIVHRLRHHEKLAKVETVVGMDEPPLPEVLHHVSGMRCEGGAIRRTTFNQKEHKTEHLTSM
ncbi:Potassium channel subfamily K member 18 [Eumeta japonica]|uniref:Potassium channel subfamily K member 18 n=1 Tax=Eumeta variegata TaxID=151549 RepID=A0A4C1UYG0_EUMVA|nr:Potassium channel subfamily K member 18 [Eumeta japonica]